MKVITFLFNVVMEVASKVVDNDLYGNNDVFYVFTIWIKDEKSFYVQQYLWLTLLLFNARHFRLCYNLHLYLKVFMSVPNVVLNSLVKSNTL